jgi:hypothetical protein
MNIFMADYTSVLSQKFVEDLCDGKCRSFDSVWRKKRAKLRSG